MDQVRKYHDLNPQKGQTLPQSLQQTMLENAVHPITELRAIKVQAEQHKIHTGAALSYTQYTTLLLAAAQQYDRQFSTSSRKPVRHVLEHDTFHVFQADGEQFDDPDSFDIDSPVAVLQAYATNFSKAPRLSDAQWNQLPDSAKKIWNQLSPDAKAIILHTKPASAASSTSGNPPRRFPPRPPPSTPTPRHVHVNEIDTLIAYLHDLRGGSTPDHPEPPSEDSGPSTDSVTTSGHEDSTIQVNAAKKLPPGNIKRLLSPSANNTTKTPRELNVNGVLYREANMASIKYTVSNYRTSTRKGALVDRGANGGIAGEDVRVIAKTSRQVDI
jgi:hypothetical protein